MGSGASEKADHQSLRKIALVVGFLVSQTSWAGDPATGAYDRSVCAELERICTTEADAEGAVSCTRPLFARALLSCVDLWEAEAVCVERLGSEKELRSVDLDSYYSQLERLDGERQEMRNRAWIWGVLGVIGWGVAAGFLVGWAMK